MQVRILGRKGAAVLVEWRDEAEGVQRAYLPVGAVQEGENGAEADSPEQGIPYGEDWEGLLGETWVATGPREVAQALRRQGVWTLHDLHNRPQDVLAAFQSAYGMDAQALRDAARRRNQTRR